MANVSTNFDRLVVALIIEKKPSGAAGEKIAAVALKAMAAGICFTSMYPLMPVAGASCQAISLPPLICQSGAWTFWGSAMTWSNWKLIDAVFKPLPQENCMRVIEPPTAVKVVFVSSSVLVGVLMESYLPYMSYLYGGHLGWSLLTMLASSGYPSYSSYLMMTRLYQGAQVQQSEQLEVDMQHVNALKKQIPKFVLLGLVYFESLSSEERKKQCPLLTGEKIECDSVAGEVISELICLAQDSPLLEGLREQEILELVKNAASIGAQGASVGRYLTDALLTYQTMQAIFNTPAISVPLAGFSVSVIAYLTHRIVGERAGKDVEGVDKCLRETAHFKERRWSYLGSGFGRVAVQAASLFGLSTTMGFFYDRVVDVYAGGWNWWTIPLGAGEATAIALFLNHVSLDMYNSVAGSLNQYLGDEEFEETKKRVLHLLKVAQNLPPEQWLTIDSHLTPEAKEVLNPYVVQDVDEVELEVF